MKISDSKYRLQAMRLIAGMLGVALYYLMTVLNRLFGEPVFPQTLEELFVVAFGLSTAISFVWWVLTKRRLKAFANDTMSANKRITHVNTNAKEIEICRLREAELITIGIFSLSTMVVSCVSRFN